MKKLRVFAAYVALALLLNAAVVGPVGVYSDDDGGSGIDLRCNHPPVVEAGEYSGDEVLVVALSDATASDPDGDPLTYSWSVDTDLCTFDDPSLLHPTLTCLDDGVFTATLTVSDGHTPPVSDDAPVTVYNVAPTCDPTSPTRVGAEVDELITFSAGFTDPGVLDEHTADWDWGDGATGTGTVVEAKPSISGTVSNQHSYGITGTYTVGLTVSDELDISKECTYTVIVPRPPCITPTVEAGVYSGTEGSAIALSDATASDPDGDPLTYSWSVNTGLCTFDDPSLLHPTLTCDDDGEFTATLTVDDGICPTVSADAPVTVENVAPTCDPTSPTRVGAEVDELITFSAGFTDPGVLDEHTADWDWGDGATGTGTVVEAKPSISGTVSNQHSYGITGTYTVGLTVTDNFPAVSNECTYTVIVPPPVCITAPIVKAGVYSGTEGSAIALSDATATDPDGDLLTYSWSVNTGLCTFDDPSQLNPTLTCDDDGEFIATLTVNDGACTPVSDDAPVTVENVAPTCNPTSPTRVGAKVDELITFSAFFTDPGVLDTHTAAWDWGDGTPSIGTVTQGEGFGTVSDQYSYSIKGAYTVTLVVTDNYGADSNKCTYIVQIPPSPTLYLPFILTQPPRKKFCEYPVFISPKQPAQKVPKQDTGKVFFTEEVEICERLPEGGRFYFSSQRDKAEAIRVDDAIAIYVGKDRVFFYDFASDDPPPYVETTVVEIPREKVEEMAGKIITVKLQDVYGVWFVSLYDVWLIWVP